MQTYFLLGNKTYKALLTYSVQCELMAYIMSTNALSSSENMTP